MLEKIKALGVALMAFSGTILLGAVGLLLVSGIVMAIFRGDKDPQPQPRQTQVEQNRTV